MKKLLVVLLLILTSCSSGTKPVISEYKEKNVEELYSNAKSLLNDDSYRSAAKAFDEVERQHPYSDLAIKASLMSAYSHYLALNYDDAELSLERYIALYPADKDIAYAYYLKALSYYEQITDVARDQTITQLAMYSLEDVVKRFPNSDYARDAKLKIDLTKTNLAGQEMFIGRYYLRKEFYNAAINRFNNVVTNYSTTNHIEEALYRLVECYMALGVYSEAEKSAAVLGYNYSESDWYKKAYSLLKN